MFRANRAKLLKLQPRPRKGANFSYQSFPTIDARVAPSSVRVRLYALVAVAALVFGVASRGYDNDAVLTELATI